MSGFRLPSARAKYTTIDLTEFGGEGNLAIYPITAGDSLALNQYIKQLAKADDIECKTDEDVANLSSTLYKLQSMSFIISRLAFGKNDDGSTEPIAIEDIYDFPPELIVKIVEVIDEGSKFPLEQTAGTGQK